eukprot:gene34672-39200_t
MIANEVFLGVKPSSEYIFAVIASPVGSYFKGGPAPVSIWVSENYTRAAVGGTGALKIGADFLQRFAPGAQVYISDPSWENHRALFESAGFTVNNYAYYDAATHGVNFAGMLAALKAMPRGSIVLLHACCHNPTGADLTSAQWDEIIAVVAANGLVPFLDMAYQGFGSGIAEDGAVVRRFAATGGPLLVSNSFSKSFSLYGERVGALSVVAASADEAARLMSQLKRVVRTNYSNPPVHGGKVVATVLTTPELRQLWEDELAGMRVRIKEMRDAFVKKLKEKAPAHEFEVVRRRLLLQLLRESLPRPPAAHSHP